MITKKAADKPDCVFLKHYWGVGQRLGHRAERLPAISLGNVGICAGGGLKLRVVTAEYVDLAVRSYAERFRARYG